MIVRTNSISDLLAYFYIGDVAQARDAQYFSVASHF